MKRIPVAGPSITEREIALVTEAVRTAWYDGANAFHDRFQRAFAAHVGRRHAIALPSCTSAIHLALAALGVGPGDEVIVPECTWIATAAPVTYLGARPVFADIDPVTWCLSAESVDRRLTPRTRAVIPVDLYGGMPDWDALRAVCRGRAALIEDAAQAIGSRYRGHPAGSLGDVGVFSFHGSKTLTTGEGGMLVTDDDALAARVSTLRDHGRPPGDTLFRNTEVAYKYKMTSMQAALGLAQLERLDELVGGKRRIFAWYRERLADQAALTLNAEPEGVTNSYWMTTIRVDDALDLPKVELMRQLAEAGIDSRPFFYPLSSLEAYRHLELQHADRENPHAFRISRQSVNLPSALSLKEEDVDHVCRALRSIVERAPARRGE